MGPEISPKKACTSKTPKIAELTPSCSCNECDTLRCFLTSKLTNNQEQLSKTCIYFTNITIRKSNSNANTNAKETSTSDTTNEKQSVCKICKPERKVENDKNTFRCDSVCKGDTKNTKHVRKACGQNIHINDTDALKSTPTKITHATNLSFNKSNTQSDTTKNAVPAVNAKKSGCSMKIYVPLEAKNSRQSKGKVCSRCTENKSIKIKPCNICQQNYDAYNDGVNRNCNYRVREKLGSIGTVENKLIPDERNADMKSKCSHCGMNVRTDEKHFKANNDANYDLIIDDLRTRYSKSKERNTGCISPITKEQSKKTSLPSAKSILLCNCSGLGKFNQTKLVPESPATEVNSSEEELYPSIAKLSAQIMNVPYEEFKDSFNYGHQYTTATKNKVKTNISNEIIKRIKDVYNACSCKVCECIAGKSIKSDNICNCKPCDCEDCRSYKNLDPAGKINAKYHKPICLNGNYLKDLLIEGRKKGQSQSCECTPCDCIKCKPLRTFITARLSENRQANDCACSPCRCLECERNFFSLSTHLTHEMSTGMMRSCGCEQCLDQRCRGAGGIDECRCQMPSKAIFKPVQKDSHDYDIRHASVYHEKSNRKHNNPDTIAMYASVSSNYPTLGTLKETCSCEECECIACKNEDRKLSMETVLKPQLEPQSIKTNTCVCKPCECEICSSDKNDIAECACGECDCINCHNMAKSSKNANTNYLAKPIGKIYYKNNYNIESQEYDNSNPAITRCSHTYDNEQSRNVCMSATLDKNCFMKSIYDPLFVLDYHNEQNVQCRNKTQYLIPETYSNYHDLEEKQLPSQDVSDKNCIDKFAVEDKHFVKASNNYEDECNAPHVEVIMNKINKIDEDSESSTFSFLDKNSFKQQCTIPRPLFSLSTYKPNSSKTTLKTCLEDILTFNQDMNMRTMKILPTATNPIDNLKIRTHRSDNICGQDNGPAVESFSHLHPNLYNNKLDGIKMSTIADICHNNIVQNRHVCNIPLVLDNKKNNLFNNQIDYERVHKTLKEAKDFSGQLIKLLDKYEKANKDFQSVSKKLKLSHGLNACSNLDHCNFPMKYLMVGKENNSYNNYKFFENVMKEKDNGLNNGEELCNYHLPSNIFSTQNTVPTITNSLQNFKTLQKYQNLVQRKLRLSEQIKISISNNQIPKSCSKDEKIYLDDNGNNIRSMESKEITKLGENHAESNDNILGEAAIFLKSHKDENANEFAQFNNILSNLEETKNTYPSIELNEGLQNDTLLNKIVTSAKTNCTQKRIDILTNQLSEMIKNNVMNNYEELPHSTQHDDVKDDFDGCKSKECDHDNFQDWSINKKNYYLNNHINGTESYLPLLLSEKQPTLEMQSMSIQTSVDKINADILSKVKSAASLPRNKTTQVEKESDTSMDFEVDNNFQKNDKQKMSKCILESETYFDLNSQFSGAHSSRMSEISRPKCSCENLKVCALSGRRISDHTVMVKWSKPKEMKSVKGYELLVDGRPVQKCIDSARCMAVVTCLPNCDKVLLTMRTILTVALRSGHQPTVTVVYRPRLKRNRNDDAN